MINILDSMEAFGKELNISNQNLNLINLVQCFHTPELSNN